MISYKILIIYWYKSYHIWFTLLTAFLFHDIFILKLIWRRSIQWCLYWHSSLELCFIWLTHILIAVLIFFRSQHVYSLTRALFFTNYCWLTLQINDNLINSSLILNGAILSFFLCFNSGSLFSGSLRNGRIFLIFGHIFFNGINLLLFTANLTFLNFFFFYNQLIAFIKG